MHLVALLEPAQDRDRVLDARLADVHRLEAALERRVLLDVLAVLVERRRADRAQLAAREHRLEHVAGVHRALGRAGADDRVQLVDEHDDLALGVGDLLQHGLQPVLELTAVLGAGDHRGEIERDHAAVLQSLGHVAGDDPLRESLGDRGLADAGLADQHGVVLGPAREDLDHAADLVVAADHRVELALRGGLGQIAAVALERLKLLLGVLVGDAVRAAHLLQRLDQLVVRRRRWSAARRRQPRDGPRAPAAGARSRRTRRRGRASRTRPRAGSGRARSIRRRAPRWLPFVVSFGSASSAAFDGLAHGAGLDPELAQHGHDDPLILLEQDGEQVRRSRLRVAALVGQLLGGLERLLGLDRKTVWLHRRFRWFQEKSKSIRLRLSHKMAPDATDLTAVGTN